MKDKYSAIWVSHSSISDYLKCPRAYYLKNVYKDPKNNHKINIMSPSLALGQTVHKVIESISTLPVERRFEKSLLDLYEIYWQKISGEKGGFSHKDEEENIKQQGKEMIQRVINNPGPLKRKAIKIREDLPYFWLSEVDNIILCGKIDWLEYIVESDSVKIIDFKTGKYDEDPNSLQLPIYHLLVKNSQSKNIVGVAYWYLDRDNEPIDASLPSYQEASQRVLEIAKHIVLARKLERFVCGRRDGCMFCHPFETILVGKAKFVGEDDFRHDLYVISHR
ncbi:PD-(D/E)XK nuclease family protein [Candidatus Gottesmanbacteria bacterium]|nr:PD-(D/E)XK nuclease family protein [Candidatus Gottesmanbacteria bacterium]